MPDTAPILSRKTRQLFREHLVGYTLRQITDEFDSEGLSCDLDHFPEPPISGQRRTLVEQYYACVDWASWTDVRRILTVFEHVLIRLEQDIAAGTASAEAPKVLETLTTYLARDGFSYTGGRITRAVDSSQLTAITEVVQPLDAPELQRQIRRMEGAIEDDPALAIGTAKELLETVSRTILVERGLEAEDSWDLPRLVREVRSALQLLPEQMPDGIRGAEAIKRLLGQLGAVAQSLGELRNLYGTGHGRTGSRRPLAPRHARLAVGAAATLATFLLETHQEKRDATSGE